MTVAEIHQKRVELQRAIGVLVKAFEDETSVMVSRILPQHEDVSTLGCDRPQAVLTGVRVEVML